jgi:hypothetical protein
MLDQKVCAEPPAMPRDVFAVFDIQGHRLSRQSTVCQVFRTRRRIILVQVFENALSGLGLFKRNEAYFTREATYVTLALHEIRVVIA